jgi:hypothetical protein
MYTMLDVSIWHVLAFRVSATWAAWYIPFLAILFASCVSDIKNFISLVPQKSTTNDIMSLTVQYPTPLKRKFADAKVVVFMEGEINTGSCWWKLSSGNLYTFIRPNQEQKRKMQLQVPGRNRAVCAKLDRSTFRELFSDVETS